jgi:hypothetical protein
LHTDFALNQSGQLALVRLVGGQPQIVDYLTWSDLGVNLSYGSLPDGQAIHRLVLYTPTPATTNQEPVLRVFINEWMARNSTTVTNPVGRAYDDWFEIYNAEPFTVNLAGYWLTDNAANPTKYQIPTNGQYRIPPRGYLMVWADNQSSVNAGNRPELHVNFQLSGSAGDVALFRPDGVTAVDVISYLNQVTDVSQGRFADGARARYSMTKSTPGGPNVISSYNSPPVFPFIPTQVVAPGQTATVTIRATDPEGTPLVYEIVSAPPPPQLNQDGRYRWVVPGTQAVGDYPVTVSAIDSGVPPRTATTTFIMAVRTNGVVIIPPTPPVFERIFTAGGEAFFTIDTVPGRTYRVAYTDDLVSGNWIPLDNEFVAGGLTASLTDTQATPQRFYRVQRLN